MRSNLFRLSTLCLALAGADCGADVTTPMHSGAGRNQGEPGGGTHGSGGDSSSGTDSPSARGGSTASTPGADGAGGSDSTTGSARGKGGGASVGGSASGGSRGEEGAGGAGKGGQKQAGGSLVSSGQGGRGVGPTVPDAGVKSGTGGSTSTEPSGPVDCNAAMPTGGSDHCGQNTQGKAGDQTWSLWSNANSSSGCITTFSTAAFSARWNNNNDFLARIGLEFGNSSKTYDQYGTLKADFAFKKTGSAGGYSYIGIYGWTNNPCVEWYIVDDRFGTMPFSAYNASQKGTANIDGADYKLFQNKTNGTGGSRCSGVSQWDQYWSIRQTARQCGTITISDHFDAWEKAGLKMGGLLEAKILVETGGGSGSIDFPVARVTAQ